MKKVFLVPVYNEEDNISQLLKSISKFAKDRSWDFCVYIVDDGSTDKTLEVANRHKDFIPLNIFALEKNMGPGAAFKKGFKEILSGENENALIITLEADSTGDLDILETMTEKAEAGTFLVLASCYAKGGGVEGASFFRKAMSLAANVFIGFISKRSDIRTYSSFYRVYKYSAIDRLYKLYGEEFMEETGFACATELFMKLARLKGSIEEVPMKLNCKRRVGKSRMKIMPTVLAYLRIFYRSIRRGVVFWYVNKKR